LICNELNDERQVAENKKLMIFPERISPNVHC